MSQLLSNFHQEVEPSETFVDPVSKIRVSQPENLIDTDFEYGLQSTKWETLELSNNVPSYYVSDSDLPLQNVVSVQATSGSDVITVVTLEPHGLVAGTPIDVRGLTSRTAEGKFLIKSVPDDFSFTYVGNGNEIATQDIGSVYATITPGQFYAGSQLPYDGGVGIQTDGQPASLLTVNTPFAHGFKVGSSFYLVNSIGTKKVVIQPLQDDTALTDTAPDGRPYVDADETAPVTITPNLSLTETKAMRSTYYYKFDASSVDTSTNYINWPNHQLHENDTLLYVPPANDDAIGGLQRFYVYYVDYIDSNHIRLRTSWRGSVVNLTSEGTYNYGRAGLHLCYEVYYMNAYSRSYYTNYWTNAAWNGYRSSPSDTNGRSGWDFWMVNSSYGLGQRRPTHVIPFSRNGYGISSSYMRNYFSSYVNSLMQMPEGSTTPGSYNWIEDFQRWSGLGKFQANNVNFYRGELRQYDYSFRSSNNSYYTYENRFYYMFVEPDDEAETFFATNSDLQTNSGISMTVNSGNGVYVNTNTSTSLFSSETTQLYGTSGNHTVERVSTDRFRIRWDGSSSRNRLKYVDGSIEFDAVGANPLANTFYVPNHGFATNDNVRIEIEGGGALPSTETGVITLDTRPAQGNLLSAWNVLNTAMDDYTDTLAGHQPVVLNGSTGSTNRAVNSGVAAGNSLLEYMDFGSTPYIRSYYSDNTTVRPSNTLYLNDQSSTLVKDAARGTQLSGKGASYVGTEYTRNTSVPHFSLAYGWANPNTRDVVGFRIYNRINATQMTRRNQNNVSYNVNGDAGWRASYTARYDTDPGATGYVEMNIVIWNNAWVTGYSHPLYYVTNNGDNSTQYVYPNNPNSSFWGKPLMFRTLFMLAPNSSYGTSDVDGLATALVQAVGNNFVNPSISDGQNLKTVVVNQNRIRLSNNAGIGVNVTNTGTAPYSLTQDGVVGTNDGSYKIAAVPQENQLQLQLPFLSAVSSISIDSESIANDLVTTEVEHFFAPGSRITYITGSSSDGITGLSSGTEYYLYVQDEFTVGFAETYQDALDGVLLPISTAGAGLDSLQYDIVNGRVSGAGTVSTVSGSKLVEGDEFSLFKRYFKVGDTIGIKDNNATPGKIEEYTIAAIADDQTMQLTDVASATTIGTKYFLQTKLYARPDGYAIHRPFDGGVEIAAGTSPNSQIARQTRKYFRYQSGKGIQTSLAINFNPPVQFETLEATTRDFIDPGTEVYEVSTNAPDTTFLVEAPTAGAYVLDDEENPELTLIRGYTYTFQLNATGHPFWIQTVGGGYDSEAEYTGSELVGNGFETGIITFTPDATTPNTLYYQCQFHEVMGNTINIIDDPGTPLAYDLNDDTSPTINLVRGQTYEFAVSTDGYPFWITSAPTYDEFNEFNDGVDGNGNDNGIITFAVPEDAPTTLYYSSEANDVAGGTINVVNPVVTQIRVAKGVTKYPHRLKDGTSIRISGASDDTYNGDFRVSHVFDDVTFEYDLPTEPSTSIPGGFIQYNLNGYTGAYTRAGMFDFQNGFFFEFDGQELYCVRRSSTQQLSGTVQTFPNSNVVLGTSTNFEGQLTEGDKIVLRGSTHKVVKIVSRNELIIQPQYKGVASDNVIVTKTVDVRVPRSEWSVDPCDGTGPTGYNLDLNKIQMAYMDYSWYGAGKIRFGFKDQNGHVKYVHEFKHNNVLDEAYMRSGNLPAKYEIENEDIVEYAPTLFHWGTSVIMDGRFDQDDSYLFTAASDSLSFTNGQSLNATSTGVSQLVRFYNRGARNYDWYVRIPFATSDADKFSTGTPLYTDDGSLNGEKVDFTQFTSGRIDVYLFVARQFFQPAIFPTVANGEIVYIGAPNVGGDETVNLGTDRIPLLTIRLAPSVDSNLSGALGAREIINRMQLKLQEVGLVLTHDCEVSLILNGDLSSVEYQDVSAPSLSQLIKHTSGDKVVGGTELFSFRASGGTVDQSTGKRLSAASNFPLDTVIDMGNSILGGDGTFPNGPDILTVIVKVNDTQGISAQSPFVASSRITWSESQA